MPNMFSARAITIKGIFANIMSIEKTSIITKKWRDEFHLAVFAFITYQPAKFLKVPSAVIMILLGSFSAHALPLK